MNEELKVALVDSATELVKMIPNTDFDWGALNDLVKEAIAFLRNQFQENTPKVLV